MAGFTILLPPSDEKESGGNSLAPKMFDRRSSNTFNYFVNLNPERRQIIEAVNQLSGDAKVVATALGVGDDDLSHARSCNSEVMVSPLMSALDRYEPGTHFQALDFENLPTGAQRRLLEHGIIISPMFGLLRPDDLIPEYYLQLDAELPKVGSVYDYWKPYVTNSINELTVGHFVWDLLPPSYRSLWEPDNRSTGIVEVVFLRHQKGKGLVPITDTFERQQGLFVNMLVRGSANSVDALEGLEHPEGFRYEPNESTWDEETRRGVVAMVAP